LAASNWRCAASTQWLSTGLGQGEALRLQKIPSRPDYEVPGGAAYDYVASRKDVDPKRVAIMAYSMGGYYAPRVAAFEKRYAACIAWGGHYDYHATWITRRKIQESGGTQLSAPHYQLPWVMGMPDMDSAMKKCELYKLEGVANKITCPFLVTHGEEDSISPVANAKLLHDAVSSKKKTLKVFTAEEGGAEHCQGDNRFLGADLRCRLDCCKPLMRIWAGLSGGGGNHETDSLFRAVRSPGGDDHGDRCCIAGCSAILSGQAGTDHRAVSAGRPA